MGISIWWNVARAALAGGFPVMARKVMRRVFPMRGQLTDSENRAWLAQHATSFDAWACARDAALHAEAQTFAAGLRADGERILAGIPYALGGGGHYAALYFLARLCRPQVAMETGVAAGFASAAILTALEANGDGGRLFSSDFPYFRLPNPERYIGILVPERLRARWTCMLRGDEVNVPRSLAASGPIALFHYDSDKTYEGRHRTWLAVRERLAPGASVLFDDIQDNSHFHDEVVPHYPGAWTVWPFEGKYVGCAGPFFSGAHG